MDTTVGIGLREGACGTVPWRVLLRFVFLAAMLHGCTDVRMRQRAPDEADRTVGRRAVIFVPGFKGSALARSDDGELVWISPWEALFGDRTLALESFGLTPAATPAGDLVPTGVLGGLSAIFGLYHYDIYETWLTDLASIDDGVTVVELAYDWRMSIPTAARSLAAAVRTLRERGAERVSIVAHSMGGLVTAYYLRYGDADPAAVRDGAFDEWSGARRVDRVVFAYVPFGGTLAILRDMRLGVTTGLNKTLLDPIALSSFPSSYALLPTADDTLLDTNGRVIRASLLDESTWQRYHLGITDRLRDPHERQKITRLLAEAAELHALLSRPPVPRGPSAGPVRRDEELAEVRFYVTDAITTLVHAIVTEDGLWYGERDDPALRQLMNLVAGPGDGTISRRALELPDSFKQVLRYERRTAAAQHDQILNDEEIREEIIDFVTSGDLSDSEG